jgi:hypothetical protein
MQTITFQEVITFSSRSALCSISGRNNGMLDRFGEVGNHGNHRDESSP